MRRVLEIIAVLFLLAGLELAAGTLSHTLRRVEDTLRLSFAGESLVWPAPVFIVGFVLIIFGVMLALVTVWARAAGKAVQASPNCPRCGTRTNRMKRRLRHKVLAAVMGHHVTRRHCAKCGWGGLSLKQ